MKCPTCGTELPENVKFCPVCGTAVASARPAPVAPVAPAPTAPVSAPVTPAAAPAAPASVVQISAPPAPKLLGPWAYFGLQLLFSIPLIGLVFLIVFSLDDSNLNRRNYARSYWCALIISLILIIVCAVIFAVTGMGAAILSEL